MLLDQRIRVDVEATHCITLRYAALLEQQEHNSFYKKNRLTLQDI